MEGGEVLNSGVEWRSQPVTVGVQGSRYAAPFCKARPVFDAPHGFEAVVHIIILRAIENETSDNRWCRAILIACGIADETLARSRKTKRPGNSGAENGDPHQICMRISDSSSKPYSFDYATGPTRGSA